MTINLTEVPAALSAYRTIRSLTHPAGHKERVINHAVYGGCWRSNPQGFPALRRFHCPLSPHRTLTSAFAAGGT